jgi:hypothetical protein
LRSACSPAPEEQSLPAIVSATGAALKVAEEAALLDVPLFALLEDAPLFETSDGLAAEDADAALALRAERRGAVAEDLREGTAMEGRLMLSEKDLSGERIRARLRAE